MAGKRQAEPIISFTNVSFYGRNGSPRRFTSDEKKSGARNSISDQIRRIITEFNADVYPGEKLLIYGPSGTGKTTLFRLLLGFVEPDEGTVAFEGTPVKGKYAWYVRAKTGYVPQVPDLGEGRTGVIVKELFDFKQNQSLKVSEEKIREAFNGLGLPRTIMEDRFETLSGGEKQRLGFAITLLLNREVLLLDEPTTSLDGESKKRVIDMTTSLDEHRTILVVSHDEAWKKTGSFRILEMKQ